MDVLLLHAYASRDCVYRVVAYQCVYTSQTWNLHSITAITFTTVPLCSGGTWFESPTVSYFLTPVEKSVFLFVSLFSHYTFSRRCTYFYQIRGEVLDTWRTASVQDKANLFPYYFLFKTEVGSWEQLDRCNSGPWQLYRKHNGVFTRVGAWQKWDHYNEILSKIISWHKWYR
jgi:hypothetical protein